jgi:hypothetical protein
MPASIRKFRYLPLVLACYSPCSAWDTEPHQMITRAALDALPKSFLSRLGPEVEPLAALYCIYPDRYEEMERYGFVRKSPGPRSAAEIRVYCVHPDGHPVHGATGDREMDRDSLVYVLEGIIANLSQQRPSEAARYAGVLAHFIEDSLSPPHAVSPEELMDLTQRVAPGMRGNIHSAIEKSVPGFTLQKSAVHPISGTVQNIATTILDQCYAGAETNQEDLPAIVRAATGHDEPALNGYRLRAGKTAAQILANALYSIFDARLTADDVDAELFHLFGVVAA